MLLYVDSSEALEAMGIFSLYSIKAKLNATDNQNNISSFML